MADVVVVSGLRKDYGEVCAVDGIDLRIAEGEVFALVGPNGAGKTTTVEILEGHRRRTSGEVQVLGYDPETGGRAFRERIGIVLQDAGFDEEFTVRELVRLYTGMYPRRYDVDELIDLVGLADKRGSRVSGLSGGQRRRLDLALGLAGRPALLFLDEPTTGFDPAARRRAWDLIATLRHSGTTIVLTTHYLEEAERLADRVAVVDAGHVVAVGTPDQLAERTGDVALLTFRCPPGIVASDLPPLGTDLRLSGGTVEISTARPTEDLHALTAWAIRRGVELESLALSRPTLEHVYLDLTSGSADEPGDGSDGGAGPGRG